MNISSNIYFIPKELQVEIHNRLDTPTLVKCRQVCQLWKSLVEENIQYELALTGLNYVPPEIAEAFGGQKKILELPVLSTGNKDGDYLDFFKPSEMKESLMRGQDKFRRPFIAFKILTNSEISIITIFKRYIDSKSWVACFSHPYPQKGVLEIQAYFGFGSGVVNCTPFAHATKQLINGNSIQISPKFRVKLKEEKEDDLQECLLC